MAGGTSRSPVRPRSDVWRIPNETMPARSSSTRSRSSPSSVVFALISMLCYEAGFRIGRWWQDGSPASRRGRPACWSARSWRCSRSCSRSRWAWRRTASTRGAAMVLDEANAIGTAYLRAGYLPEPASEPDPGAAARVRAAAHRRTDRATSQADIARSAAIQASSGRSPRRRPHDRPGDYGALHRVAQRGDRPARDAGHGHLYARVPETIIWLLFIGSALTLGMVGTARD